MRWCRRRVVPTHVQHGPRGADVLCRALVTDAPSHVAPTNVERAPLPPKDTGEELGDRSHETDVVIIGSGIGGLCCGAVLAWCV